MMNADSCVRNTSTFVVYMFWFNEFTPGIWKESVHHMAALPPADGVASPRVYIYLTEFFQCQQLC